jgi:hypothetical protein
MNYIVIALNIKFIIIIIISRQRFISDFSNFNQVYLIRVKLFFKNLKFIIFLTYLHLSINIFL